MFHVQAGRCSFAHINHGMTRYVCDLTFLGNEWISVFVLFQITRTIMDLSRSMSKCAVLRKIVAA